MIRSAEATSGPRRRDVSIPSSRESLFPVKKRFRGEGREIKDYSPIIFWYRHPNISEFRFIRRGQMPAIIVITVIVMVERTSSC